MTTPESPPARRAHRCANHPERPAHARCMRCHRSLCQECTTPWEGIHYCASCLAHVRRGARRQASRAPLVLLLAATLGLLWLLPRALVATGALLAALR